VLCRLGLRRNRPINSPLTFPLFFGRLSPAGFEIIWGVVLGGALKQAAQGQMADPGILSFDWGWLGGVVV